MHVGEHLRQRTVGGAVRFIKLVAHSRIGIFVLALLAALFITVPVGLAVGWVTIGPAEIQLAPFSFVGSYPNAVYSQQMRIYQNQTQVDNTDPNLHFEYIYPPTSTIWAEANIVWNFANPFIWSQSGGNKYAQCTNRTGQWAGRAITCQFYSTV